MGGIHELDLAQGIGETQGALRIDLEMKAMSKATNHRIFTTSELAKGKPLEKILRA